MIWILFVDDEPDLLKIGKASLERLGDFNVTTASGASEAIDLLNERSFDVIISDYQMPKMDGIAFLKHLKAGKDRTPFILFTGKGREEVVIEALNNGADFYLQKGALPSARFAELSQKILVAVSRRRSESDLQRQNDELTRQDHIIQESEKQFESLYMHMIEGAVLHDLTYNDLGDPDDYVIIKTNPAFERQLGISKDSVIGKTSRAAYGVAEPPYLDIYSRVALTGEPEVFETYYPPMEKHFSISVYCPYKGSFATIFEDITDRKKTEYSLLRKNEELQAAYEEIASTEEELRSNLDELTRQESILRINEERLLMAQKIGHIGCWEYDLETNKIWGSAEGLHIFGFPPIAGDILIDGIEACIPEREQVHQALIDLINEGASYNLEFIIQPADGSAQKFVHSVAHLEKDVTGNPIRVIGVIQDITDSKKADDDLRESQERLKFALEGTNDGIWDVQMDTGSVYLSPRGCEILGYTPDEMAEIVLQWSQLVHPDDMPITNQALNAYLEGKTTIFQVEQRLKTKSGEWKWIVTRGKAITSTRTGEPTRMVGTHTDISERKRIQDELAKKHFELLASYEQITASEEELKQNLQEITQGEQMLRVSEERLVMAQEIGHVGSWEYSLKTGQIWGSAEGFHIYGFPPVAGDIDIEKIEACIPERERVHQALVDLIARGQEYNLEFTINPADGSPPKIIYSIARIEKDREGNPLKVRGVIQDISDLKKKEEALRESNTFLENLIASANGPIIVWDPTFRIIRFNRAFELLTGRNTEEIVGHSLEILFPASQIDRSMRLIRTTRDGVRWQTVEIEIQHVNGSIRTIVWNSSTLYSPDGCTPVATIAQGQDVTEQKRLEQEKDVALGQIKQNLAQLSILNDEIRNPLTVISLFADTIGDKKIAEQIIGQTQRIDEMVRQLDRRWIESEKVIGFLRRHYQLSFEQQEPQQSFEEKDTILPDGTQGNSTILVQEVQAELFTILDSIDALVYVADIRTHELLFMNRKGRSLFGGVIGKKCYETLQKGQNKPCPFCTNSFLIDSNGPTGVYQWEFQNPKNGRWYDCRDQAIRWVDGRLVRLEIATDITDRIRALEELRESEERLRQITETISIVYYVHDRGSNLFVYVSPAYETIWKRSRQELYTDPYSFIEAIHPDDRSFVLEAIRTQSEDKEYIDIEYRIIQPDGRIRWIHSRNSPVFNNERVVYRIAGFAEDITERKRTEEELQLHSQIVQKMAEGVVIITASDGVIVYANPRFEQMFGYDADEFTGRNISCVNAPGEKSPEFIANEIITSLKESGIWSGEVENIRKDGTTFWCHANVSTFYHHIHGEVWISVHEDITEWKLAEKSLHESKDRYWKLVQNIPDYILVHRDGKILFVNTAAATSFGYNPEELINSDLTRYVTPQSQSIVAEMMHKRVSGEKIPPYEITILTKDGRQKITEVHGVLIQYEGGPASLNVLTDVTERRHALDELRESEEKFRSIFDMMNDGIHIHEIAPDGKPGKFVDVNEVACRMIQYTRKEMLERSPFDFVTGYHSRPLNEIIGELSTTGHSIFETELRRKDGTIVPVEINSNLVNLQGKLMTISVVRDITARKQIEDALRTSESKYRQLVEHANDAIVVAQNGMLQLINPQMVKLTGFSPEELLSQPFPTFIHPDDRAMVVDMYRKRIAGDNPPSRYSFRLVRKDVTFTWVEISSVVVEWEGSPATLNFLIDITERKQAEEALLESNKKLRLLTSLTRHDIFNQISAAELYGNLALSSSDLAQVHGYVSHSKKANERIEAIIGFTREYEDFGIVSSGWQQIHHIIESAKGEVAFDVVTVENLIPENIEIYADPIIRKVFTTLIENAIRHGGVITVIQFSCHEHEDSLIITCVDDGIGIPGWEKEQIFDHGYGKHTGIGLFLAREILSITGLSIRECGFPGEGARFEIMVPNGKFRFLI